MAKLLGDVVRYESGEMTDDETAEFFQGLVDTGLAWQLQGSYGRMARALIDAGEVTMEGRFA